MEYWNSFQQLKAEIAELDEDISNTGVVER